MSERAPIFSVFWKGRNYRADAGEPLGEEPHPRHEELRRGHRRVAREYVQHLLVSDVVPHVERVPGFGFRV